MAKPANSVATVKLPGDSSARYIVPYYLAYSKTNNYVATLPNLTADSIIALTTDIKNGTLTIQKNGTNVQTFTANQSSNVIANITVPVNFNDLSNRGEEYLAWGGTSWSGSVSPVGVAMSLEHSSNRLAFISGDALTFEYSSDGGSTWTNYNYSASDKSAFCTTSKSVPIGRPDGTTNLVANQSKSRITLTAQNGTTGYVYTSAKKMLVRISSATTLSMLVEYRTGTNYLNDGAWTTFGTYNVSGWSR